MALARTVRSGKGIAMPPGARLPKVDRGPVDPLSVDDVAALVRHAPPDLSAAIVLGAGTGLRQGEAMAVTADRVDWSRRNLRVDRQVWTPRKAPATVAMPKSPRVGTDGHSV